MTAVTEVEEKLILSGFLVVTPCNGRCPRHTVAMPPFARIPIGTELICIYRAVERPVHHVVGREDGNRLDGPIGVLVLLSAGHELLGVVRAVDVESSVVL